MRPLVVKSLNYLVRRYNIHYRYNMAQVKFSQLLKPLTIGRTTLPNRFVMPAMQRALCRDGRLLPEMADYYRRRVEGGVGTIIGEGCAVEHSSSNWDSRFPRLNPSTLDQWQRCVGAVHAAGGAMLLQLSHPGALRPDSHAMPTAPDQALSPSGRYSATGEKGRAATISELAEIRDAFVDAAILAQQAGFEGIELHGCHGFFLDQFLWDVTNLRDDRYGGATLVERARYPSEIVAAIRAATGPGFLICYRFSQWKEVDYAAQIAPDPAQLGAFLTMMRAAGVDLFHASTRRFNAPAWPDDPRSLAAWTRELGGAPVIAVGSVGLDTDVMSSLVGATGDMPDASTRDPGLLEDRFAMGDFDLIAIGRSLLADPDWVNKMAEGRLNDIRVFKREDMGEALEMEPLEIRAAHGYA